VTTEPLIHTAFYKFIELPNPDLTTQQLKHLTVKLLGNILVASEGINGVLAGTVSEVNLFEHRLHTDSMFEGRFADMIFKRSECTSKPFARMKVRKKNEIVALGLPLVTGIAPKSRTVSAQSASTKAQSNHLSPQQWREFIRRDDVVVLDNRNSFEYRLGKFKNALDPEVAHFRDFPLFVEKYAPQWQAEKKKVAMYCTGGIRCEKTSAWMEQYGLQVYQLEGGILNYFQSLPDAEKDWEGECFVFDSRIALDTKLRETDTTAEQVYESEKDGAWRIERARRLDPGQ
jgi:UPF0176 protein